MKQQENNKNFDFSNDMFSKIHTQVEKKSYKKIAFLGLALGFGLMLGYGTVASIGGFFSSLGHYMDHRHDKQIMQDNLDIVKFSKTIKAITPEDFKGFLAYMKVQQDIYDEKVAIVSDTLVKAERDWKGNSREIAGIAGAERLNNDLTEHKKAYNDLIDDSQHVYNDILNNDVKSLKIDEVRDFINAFNSYKANVVLHDSVLEKSINDKLFLNYQGNKEYNMKYHINDKIKQADQNMKNTVNSLKIDETKTNINKVNTNVNDTKAEQSETPDQIQNNRPKMK